MKYRYPAGWPRRKCDLEGRRVRALEKFSNGYGHVDVGAEGEIRRAFGGLSIRFDVCPKCKVGLFVTRVDPRLVELLPRQP